MDFRRLEAFCKVYELRSFSKAGQEIFLSQPTISAHISSLEEELGVRLFDRLGRSILPTQAGDTLYKTAREIFDKIDQATSEINLLRDKIVGELHIGASTIPASYILPGLLAEFCSGYPEVQVHLSTGDSEEITRRVLSGELLLGVVGAPSQRTELVSSPLQEDELVTVASPRLLSSGKYGKNGPTSWPWIMRERGSGTRKAFEQALERDGLSMRDLNVACWLDSTESVLQCVLAGVGLSVTSRLAAAPYLDRGELVAVDALLLDLKRSFHVIHRDGRHFFPAVRLFLDKLKQVGTR